jgi:sarcosine oxidase subunit beta
MIGHAERSTASHGFSFGRPNEQGRLEPAGKCVLGTRTADDFRLKAGYDVVVIGGGGHGLATAYYLAKDHGVTNVAVLKKGSLGGGDTGRNTTVVRSDYLFPESAALYDLSLRLYESAGRDLNFNIMFSQRGYMTLIHKQHQLESTRHKVNWLACNGVDGEFLARAEVRRMVPLPRTESGYAERRLRWWRRT